MADMARTVAGVSPSQVRGDLLMTPPVLEQLGHSRAQIGIRCSVRAAEPTGAVAGAGVSQIGLVTVLSDHNGARCGAAHG